MKMSGLSATSTIEQAMLTVVQAEEDAEETRVQEAGDQGGGGLFGGGGIFGALESFLPEEMVGVLELAAMASGYGTAIAAADMALQVASDPEGFVEQLSENPLGTIAQVASAAGMTEMSEALSQMSTVLDADSPEAAVSGLLKGLPDMLGEAGVDVSALDPAFQSALDSAASAAETGTLSQDALTELAGMIQRAMSGKDEGGTGYDEKDSFEGTLVMNDYVLSDETPSPEGILLA